MRLLLDTHLLIWMLATPERLSQKARDLVSDPANILFVSAVTITEIAVKYALGRRDAPPFSSADTIRACEQAGYVFLDLTAQHAAIVEMLPLLHKDPFDRLLVAQALHEPLRIVTHDAKVAAYDTSVISV